MSTSPNSHSGIKTFKILSIDGGGIKGLFSARILESFEERFNCHIADHFDLICGTSTGGLIALGLSLNIPVSLISNLYYERGNKIFPQKLSILRSIRQFAFGSKYDNKELRQALCEIFGSKILSDSKTLLCIPAFSLTDGRPYIFKYDHKEGNLVRDNNTKYIDIALATSAAPTFLPIITIDTYDNKQFVDGGVYANNPTLIGIIEALRYFVGKDKEFHKLQVLSISSLESNPGRRFIAKHSRSVIDWKQDLISIFGESQAYQTQYFVETLAQYCDSPFDYVRIPSANLSPNQARVIKLDSTSSEALNIISQKGRDQALFWEKKDEVAQFFNTCKQYVVN